MPRGPELTNGVFRELRPGSLTEGPMQYFLDSIYAELSRMSS